MKTSMRERKITVGLDDFGKDRDFLQHTINENLSCMDNDEVGIQFEVGAPTNENTWHDIVMIIDMLKNEFSANYDVIDVGYDDEVWGWLSFTIKRPIFNKEIMP